MLYHLNRLNGVFADQLSPDELLVKAQRHGELANLLGFSDNDMAQAGYLYVEDTIVNGEQLQVRHHNHIDRFTGGVRNSALFAEELLYQPSFRLTVNIDKNYPLSETLQQAVNETIYDLKQGLLAIAGGTSRGGGANYGYCGSFRAGSAGMIMDQYAQPATVTTAHANHRLHSAPVASG